MLSKLRRKLVTFPSEQCLPRLGRGGDRFQVLAPSAD